MHFTGQTWPAAKAGQGWSRARIQEVVSKLALPAGEGADLSKIPELPAVDAH
jgi:hypothetical protein